MDEIRIGSLAFARLASAADNRIESADLFEETSLVQDDLAYNTLSASLFSTSRAVLDTPYGAAVRFYRNGSLHSTYYKEAVKRTGPNTYSLSAVSRVGLLERMEHRGGVYTGQTAGEVIREICASIPVQVKSALEGVKLYGWLPFVKPPDSSARDNLAQVLFAIGASVKTDWNGNLRVEGLWDGMTGTVSRERVYSGGNVEYGEKYTAVSVAEHQYIQGTEEAQLFEGTAQEGDLITFDEPMHSLTAAGFSILDSGANYARVSAGTGTLTGKKYIHNTRQAVKSLHTADTENVKTVNDATLVSLVNSDAVANRLAAYYQCEESIDVPVVAQRETPGDVLQVYHPYDRKMVPACLQSADISLSNTLKAQEKLLVGFVPSKIGGMGYIDFKTIIKTDGIWTPPEGVRHVRAVVIQGGSGGCCGKKGDDADPTVSIFTRVATNDVYKQTYYKKGASGGAGGEGGSGGNFLIVDIDIKPGQRFNVKIGKGGKGAPFSAESAEGNEGEHSTFGEYSSLMGSSSPTGYLDPISGDIYAATGTPGIAGGNGSGSPDESESTSEIIEELVTGPDGTIYYPGENPESSIIDHDSYSSINIGCSSHSGRGGGAAVGANGNPGSLDGASASAYASSLTLRATVVIGPGGNGATATAKGLNNTTIGGGGHGGHGGGGAGGYGKAASSFLGTKNGTANFSVPAIIPVGGDGGEGGDGGPGGIILYYSAPKPDTSGPIATRDGKFLLDRHGRRIIV